MRLLTTKALYRAFPELDHFSAEQCRSFVEAAKRDLLPRLTRVALQAVTSIITLVLALVATRFIGQQFGASGFVGTDSGFLVFGAGMIFFAFGSAALAFLLTRDFLLRHRIRGVMRSRGSCNECGYGLTGLPISTTSTTPDSTSHAVVCPECGTLHPANAKLGETIEDVKGTLRYVPSPNAPGRIRPGVARRFIRHNTKLVAAVSIFFVLAITIPLVGYEVFLRRQAAQARANILDSSALALLIAKTFPTISDHSSTADLHPFDRINLLHGRVEFLQTQLSAQDNRYVWLIDPEQTAFLGQPPEDPRFTPELLASIRSESKLGLAAIMQTDVFAELDEIAAMPRRLPLIDVGGQVLSIYPPFNMHQGSAIALLGLHRAKIRRAILDGDQATVARSLRTHLLLIGHMATVPSASAQILAQSEHAATINLAVQAIYRNRNAASLATLLDSLREPPDFPTPSQINEINHAITRSFVAQIFSDPENVRYGRHSRFFAHWIDHHPPVTVGTYTSSLAEIESNRALQLLGCDKDRFERPIPTGLTNRHATTLYTLGNSGFWLEFSDTRTALTRAVPVFLAIERFRLDNSRLPTTLDELIPTYIASIPIDPFSGKPLLYRPNTDPNVPDSYAIYSTGPDQVDHGAVFPPEPHGGRRFRPQFPDTPLITMPPASPARR